jgi:hypothetical protein
MMDAPRPFERGERLSAARLNGSLDVRVRDVVGGPYIKCSRLGDRVSVSLAVDKLLERIPRTLWIGQITGNAAGGGKYQAKSIGGGSSAVATGNLAASDLGTLASAVDVLFLNLEEVGDSTHVLTEDSSTPYATGKIIGRTAEGLAIVAGLSIESGCDE